MKIKQMLWQPDGCLWKPSSPPPPSAQLVPQLSMPPLLAKTSPLIPQSEPPPLPLHQPSHLQPEAFILARLIRTAINKVWIYGLNKIFTSESL